MQNFMIQQKQKDIQYRINRFNQHHQSIIPRAKKQPLPLLNERKNQRINRVTRLNPETQHKHKNNLLDLFIHQQNRQPLQIGQKLVINSRTPSQSNQQNVPIGINNNKIRTNKQSKDSSDLGEQHLQSKLVRRCCNQSNIDAQHLRRYRSSSNQFLHKLQLRKLQPLKFSINSKMRYQNYSSPQYNPSLRAKNNKSISKGEEKQLTEKLSKPKQFFHNCNKKNCQCFKLKPQINGQQIQPRQTAMRQKAGIDVVKRDQQKNQKIQNQQVEEDNLRVRKVRRIAKLKPIKTQPTTIQINQIDSQNSYQLISIQSSQIDVLGESNAKNMIKTKRRLEEIVLHEPLAYLQGFKAVNKVKKSVEIQVQTQNSGFQQNLRKGQYQKQMMKSKVNSSVSEEQQIYEEIEDQCIMQPKTAILKKQSIKHLQTLRKESKQVNGSQLQESQSHQNSKAINKAIKLTHHPNVIQNDPQNKKVQINSDQKSLQKLQIIKRLHNSHQYDFAISINKAPESKDQKFKRELLSHFQKTDNLNFQNQVSNLQSQEKLLKKDIDNKAVNEKQIKSNDAGEHEQISDEPIGLLTVSRIKTQISDDSFVTQQIGKQNASKHRSPNQFNKYKSLSKASNQKTIFKVPNEDQYMEFIKNYKTLNPQFDLKSLIIKDNFKALSYEGGFYFGQMENQKRHGKGVYLTSKELFQGQFENDNRIKGCSKVYDGIYSGEFYKNLRHGHGIFKWNNGQIFEGQWRIGTKNGYGRWKSPQGDYYEGEWSLNMQHGKGKFKHSTSCYEGEFHKFLKHGNGVQKFPNGDQYKGQYKDGKPNGFGTYIWTDGAYYKGEFVDGLRQGKGKWHQSCNTLYEGDFFHDKKHGYGIQFYKNGSYFQGQFQNGVIVNGKLYDAHKRQIKKVQKQHRI